MPRQSPDDSGHVNAYGWKDCPSCGEKVTRCPYGFYRHLISCMRRRGLKVELAPNGGGNMMIGRRWFKVEKPRVSRKRRRSNEQDQ